MKFGEFDFEGFFYQNILNRFIFSLNEIFTGPFTDSTEFIAVLISCITRQIFIPVGKISKNT
jgi:hypothetical protein